MNTRAILDQAPKVSFIVDNNHVSLLESQKLPPPNILKLRAQKIVEPLLKEISSLNLISPKIKMLCLPPILGTVNHEESYHAHSLVASSICSNKDLAFATAPQPSKE
ncbi:hypothetical protein D8674_034184 [Pyrus ussuriensis x Pyrus communis]|uniref:Uncharacterized protein n=1 Tax=Pyrus ussuriensis x Pyrus communis TaxID=2448454 RepID=A0A5N5HN86_9ROSA|nr:hypothetical protein D8674_034184 [Pyrus ussuriensis x Pyrus communis]